MSRANWGTQCRNFHFKQYWWQAMVKLPFHSETLRHNWEIKNSDYLKYPKSGKLWSLMERNIARKRKDSPTTKFLKESKESLCVCFFICLFVCLYVVHLFVCLYTVHLLVCLYAVHLFVCSFVDIEKEYMVSEQCNYKIILINIKNWIDWT